MGFLTVCSHFLDLVKFISLCVITFGGILYRWWFPPALKSLQHDIILVTGSANGIGREICLQLAQCDSLPLALICWDINKEVNDNLVMELRRSGTKAYGFTVDIANRNQVQLTAAKVQDVVGEVSIVILNAGIAPNHPFLSHNPREIMRCFEVNVLGGFWVLRKFLPRMIEVGRGHVVSISSESVFIGSKNYVPYNASMAAVRSYMDSLRDEVRGYPTKPDIKFTTIIPGVYYNGLLRMAKTNLKDLARIAIDGIRRDYEQVYIPWSSCFLSTFLRCQPSGIRIAAAEFLESP